MDTFETVAHLGEQPIKIKTDDPNRLIKLFSYINDLNAACEGRPAVPFYRSTKDGYEYYGLRDEDGREVTFGQQRKPSDEKLSLFAYRPGADGYRGWAQYNGRQIEHMTSTPGSHTPGEEEEICDEWADHFERTKNTLTGLYREERYDDLKKFIEKLSPKLPNFPNKYRKQLDDLIASYEEFFEEERVTKSKASA